MSTVWVLASVIAGAGLTIVAKTMAHLMRKQYGGVHNVIEAKEFNIILVQAEQKTLVPFFVRHRFSLHVVIGRHVVIFGDLTSTRKEALGGLRNALKRMACGWVYCMDHVVLVPVMRQGR